MHPIQLVTKKDIVFQLTQFCSSITLHDYSMDSMFWLTLVGHLQVALYEYKRIQNV